MKLHSEMRSRERELVEGRDVSLIFVASPTANEVFFTAPLTSNYVGYLYLIPTPGRHRLFPDITFVFRLIN